MKYTVTVELADEELEHLGNRVQQALAQVSQSIYVEEGNRLVREVPEDAMLWLNVWQSSSKHPNHWSVSLTHRSRGGGRGARSVEIPLGALLALAKDGER